MTGQTNYPGQVDDYSAGLGSATDPHNNPPHDEHHGDLLAAIQAIQQFIGISNDNHLIPSGGIIMWSGLITAIPSGWALCDGTNGTPDLRDRFVVGAGNTYNEDDVGGESSTILSVSQMPAHAHTQNPVYNVGSHNHTGVAFAQEHSHSPGTLVTNNSGDHQHGVRSASNVRATGSQAPSIGASSDTLSGFGGNHSHSVTGGESGTHEHGHSVGTLSAGTHSHANPDVDSTGGDAAHDNRPPYYALAFIMKL